MASEILPVIFLSLIVSFTSTFIASVIGISAAVPFSIKNFKLKKYILRINEVLMSMPPVLMGLIVYVVLSKEGSLGNYNLLFTPFAMIIAQTLLVMPIVFTLTVSSLSKVSVEIMKNCKVLGAGRFEIFISIINECRMQILSIITTGFGRAISEVGAVMMVGGNIKGHTRVMTTFIAFETGKGNFREAFIIGGILLFISLIVNTLIHCFKGEAE
ncbi:tungstate transport system permease protein [Caloramator quimbayensis]|uniref:Tungstate transport system permease protein n=1 Tax=Caloramator quimbayensis TaxID=1147123 RepID=A0A1T4XZL4_9CLOT|nr:ABC transporter permease [Caloramator quimbayensis]SKA95002.1 tungstate transport system permease protein [Caloramator quimbayensis]